jgi:hypothetical protein
MQARQQGGPMLTWDGIELPRVHPGNYKAVCVGWQGPELVRSFRRWSIRLEFRLLTEDVSVSVFFNLGTNPQKPHVGRRSKFFAAWCMANGEMPRKHQQMPPAAFTEPGLIYLVRIGDAIKDSKDALKPEAMIYSRVTEILEVERSK